MKERMEGGEEDGEREREGGRGVMRENEVERLDNRGLNDELPPSLKYFSHADSSCAGLLGLSQGASLTS